MVELESGFMRQVNRLSRQQVEMCYHCHTCTAGCPLSVDMAYGPDRLLRLVELGNRERVFAAPDIWLCASCETCSARCPNNIDIAAVMDALRHLSVAEKSVVAEPHIRLFHQVYLSVIRIFGRSHEMVMLALYKLRSQDFLSDLGDGLRLIKRGKIPLLPHPIKEVSEVKQLIEAAEAVDRRQLEGR